MIKSILISGLILLISGCVAYGPQYKMSLTGVERPENAKARYGAIKISNIKDKDVTKYTFEDDLIYSEWYLSYDSVHFSMKNKTKHSIKLMWDEAVLVDEFGGSQMIMHSGIKYTNRSDSQSPSIIVRGATISDLILPTSNVTFVSGQYGGWQTGRLLSKNASGKTIQILLPIKIENTVNEYIFKFKVKEVLKK